MANVIIEAINMSQGCRHLRIVFREIGDVRYQFWRHGLEPMTTYRIEWPADRVELEDEASTGVYDQVHRQTDSDGSLILKWNDPGISGGPRQSCASWRIAAIAVGFKAPMFLDPASSDNPITYLKRGFLRRHESANMSDWVYRYRERIRIKAAKDDLFFLGLHGPNRRISARLQESTAFFVPNGGSNTRYFTPRDLASVVFSESGILEVDWTLELDVPNVPDLRSAYGSTGEPQDDVRCFWRALNSDRTLYDAYFCILDAHDTDDSALPAIIDLARRGGLRFLPQDYIEALEYGAQTCQMTERFAELSSRNKIFRLNEGVIFGG